VVVLCRIGDRVSALQLATSCSVCIYAQHLTSLAAATTVCLQIVMLSSTFGCLYAVVLCNWIPAHGTTAMLLGTSVFCLASIVCDVKLSVP
jgi:hypothetical protein